MSDKSPRSQVSSFSTTQSHTLQSTDKLPFQPFAPVPRTSSFPFTSSSSKPYITPLHSRGVLTATPTQGSEWLSAIQVIISYTFHDPDLLEEALESPGSGVVVVGKSHRVCKAGNTGLATVGEAVMKLVLKDQCYGFRTTEDKFLFSFIPPSLSSGKRETEVIISRIMSRNNLYRLGKVSKLEKFIRTRAPVRRTKKPGPRIWAYLKEDVKADDATRTIARGIKAVIGAVYYDGGLQEVMKVLGNLDLLIREGMPAPVEATS